MSTVVFISQTISDKRLLKESTYRYHPDQVMKEKILDDLVQHIKSSIPENTIVDLNINITLKEYDLSKSLPDKYWYEMKINDTTHT